MSYAEKVDNLVFNALVRTVERVNKKLPKDTILRSMLRTSFARLTPEQQAQIVAQMGPEWYLKLASKLDKELAPLQSDEV